MGTPEHVYLSPHFDDAALSCGGSIHQQCRGGDGVVVVTVFAAAPDGPLSPLARTVHAGMGQGPTADVVSRRRREDRAAMAVLGADSLWLDLPEALYRGDAAGWRYRRVRELFGEVHPADRGLARTIAEKVRQVAAGARPAAKPAVYAPLGVGHHVDHQIVHRAGRLLHEDGWPVLFYEDFPYCEPDDPHAGGAHSLPAVLAAEGELEGCHRRLSEDDVRARIRSVCAYDSQLGLVFGDRDSAARRIRAYAAQCAPEGPAERLWRLVPGA